MAFLLALGSLFPIMNPFAALPLFGALTKGLPPAVRNRVARTTAIAVMVIVIVAAVAGRFLLQGLGISVAALQIAGGVIVGATGLTMVTGNSSRLSGSETTSSEKAAGENAGRGIAVVPLAIPMIAGPGAISAVIAITGREPDILSLLQVLGACLVMAVLTFVVLRFGDPLLAKAGTTGLGVVTRVFGLIILAIAVELITKGMLQVFPVLGHAAH